MPLTELIALLQEKLADVGDASVEFLVVTEEGTLIAADVCTQAKAMQKALKLFNQ